MPKIAVRKPRGATRASADERQRPEESHASLLHRARAWSDARVTFDRITDVTTHCPQCSGLFTRCFGPGVLCACCGRLWLVREMLGREAGLN